MRYHKAGRTILIFLAGLVLQAAAGRATDGAAGGQAPRFFTAIRDVPLMPGLHEITEMTVTFDKPSGRIVESVAALESLPAAQVEAFYARTLPQLGWRAAGENVYVRQEETLQLGFDHVEGTPFLTIMVRPRD